jgi:hypothetical protein
VKADPAERNHKNHNDPHRSDQPFPSAKEDENRGDQKNRIDPPTDKQAEKGEAPVGICVRLLRGKKRRTGARIAGNGESRKGMNDGDQQ